MNIDEKVRALVEPVVAGLGLELYDLQCGTRLLRVMIDSGAGVGSDDLAVASKQVSRALDKADLIPGHYTLEVSSPGIERPLRTPAHFAAAVGRRVAVKCIPGGGDRRIDGTLVAADHEGVRVRLDEGDERVIPFEAIDRARVAFEWASGGRKTEATRS